MSKALIDLIKTNFGAAVLETHSLYGDDTVVVEAAAWKEVARFLRDNPACSMDMLTDLTAVDYPEREPRFEIVAHFYSLGRGHRLRLKTRTGDSEGDEAEVDSLCDLWASANWMEREVFDMFGVIFKNHPDLRRILLYPEFEGHPLRKDYPADRIQPLIPYREVPNTEKLPPFGPDEGMPFGRQTYARGRVENDAEETENV
jgi:NADH-quinone oxidoreductase subunit C